MVIYLKMVDLGEVAIARGQGDQVLDKEIHHIQLYLNFGCLGRNQCRLELRSVID